MPIQLYNTLTRQKEIFTPQEEGKVKFYVCGPTVYDYIHIGNARSAVSFDTIRRYLEYRGYEVNYVMNFTDVDDKIINRAKEENLTAGQVADKYIQAFKEDTAALNVKPATLHPRVRDHIDDIIAFVQRLIDQEYAYVSDGDVYFRTEKFEDYGQLSDQSLDELLVGASQRTDDSVTSRKENPLDFVLWKETSEGISWESPWSDGRPGWHIECSVMSTKHLGHTLDIHGGGLDLEFPHHENEIAQSQACTHQTFSNYWMHNGFVTLGDDEEKMSKSIGNVVILREMLEEVDPMVIRYLLSSVHYRRPLTYNAQAVEDATQAVQRFREVLGNLDYRKQSAQALDEAHRGQWQQKVAQIEKQFQTAMDDDFNAANGLTEVWALIRLIHQYLELDVVDHEVLQLMTDTLLEWLSIFGLTFEADEELLDADIQALIDERTQARANKDFARSDEIRDELKAQGIQLDDTPQGTRWKRVN